MVPHGRHLVATEDLVRRYFTVAAHGFLRSPDYSAVANYAHDAAGRRHHTFRRMRGSSFEWRGKKLHFNEEARYCEGSTRTLGMTGYAKACGMHGRLARWIDVGTTMGTLDLDRQAEHPSAEERSGDERYVSSLTLRVLTVAYDPRIDREAIRRILGEHMYGRLGPELASVVVLLDIEGSYAHRRILARWARDAALRDLARAMQWRHEEDERLEIENERRRRLQARDGDPRRPAPGDSARGVQGMARRDGKSDPRGDGPILPALWRAEDRLRQPA